MGNYVAGPSVLRLTGRIGAVIPGEAFSHDFSRTGPEGHDGPVREGVLLASGAIQLQPGERSELAKWDAAIAAAVVDSAPSTRTVVDDETVAAPAESAPTTAAPAASTTDDLTDSAARSSRRPTAATDSKEN